MAGLSRSSALGLIKTYCSRCFGNVLTATWDKNGKLLHDHVTILLMLLIFKVEIIFLCSNTPFFLQVIIWKAIPGFNGNDISNFSMRFPTSSPPNGFHYKARFSFYQLIIIISWVTWNNAWLLFISPLLPLLLPPSPSSFLFTTHRSFFFFCEMEFCYLVMDGFQLTMKSRLISNSLLSSCLSFPSTRLIWVNSHLWHFYYFIYLFS